MSTIAKTMSTPANANIRAVSKLRIDRITWVPMPPDPTVSSMTRRPTKPREMPLRMPLAMNGSVPGA